jgi:hypothetical protein
LDEKSSEIEIPSLQLLDYWMKNRDKSKSHPSIARLLDEKSSEIEMPSVQYLIIG